MTRFVHVDRPLAYPFFDIVIRDSNPGGMFDLSVLLEDYTGSLYVRDEHIIEMARSLGMATRDEVAALKGAIDLLESQLNKLPAAQEELKNGLADLVTKFRADLLDDERDIPILVEESESDVSFLDEAERESKSSLSL